MNIFFTFLGIQYPGVMNIFFTAPGNIASRGYEHLFYFLGDQYPGVMNIFLKYKGAVH